MFGWDSEGALLFRDEDEADISVNADATILALGGASWPRLGSDGGWLRILQAESVGVTPLAPANAGFVVGWTAYLRDRFSGQPIKNALFRFGDQSVRGEALVTGYGLEGGAIYALSGKLREAVVRQGRAVLEIDLRPDLPLDEVRARLERPRGKASLANHLRKALGLSPLEIALLRETRGTTLASDLTLTASQPVARAISTAGGVSFDAVDSNLMLRARPGVFVAGEMLDWEAPTGGYLLQACFATGVAAAKGAIASLSP